MKYICLILAFLLFSCITPMTVKNRRVFKCTKELLDRNVGEDTAMKFCKEVFYMEEEWVQ